ncbi:MAG: DUF1874 domain-containing protein [Ferruginibacter sp.]
MLTLLNAPILTTYGTFAFEAVNREQAKDLVKNGFQSFIGHQGTCDILSQLHGVDVSLNRTQYFQQPGEQALILKLKTRAAEGVVLKTIEEIEACDYEFGILNRIS